MIYHYYVSYSHIRGFGSTEMGMSAPITTFEAVVAMARAIEDGCGDFGRGDLVILNYILLRTEGDRS